MREGVWRARSQLGILRKNLHTFSKCCIEIENLQFGEMRSVGLRGKSRSDGLQRVLGGRSVTRAVDTTKCSATAHCGCFVRHMQCWPSSPKFAREEESTPCHQSEISHMGASVPARLLVSKKNIGQGNQVCRYRLSGGFEQCYKCILVKCS